MYGCMGVRVRWAHTPWARGRTPHTRTHPRAPTDHADCNGRLSRLHNGLPRVCNSSYLIYGPGLLALLHVISTPLLDYLYGRCRAKLSDYWRFIGAQYPQSLCCRII